MRYPCDTKRQARPDNMVLAFFLSKGEFETNFQAVSTLLGTGVPRFKKTPAPRSLSRPVPGNLWWYYGAGRFLMRPYMGTSPTTKCTPLGPYRRPMPRFLSRAWGDGVFLWAGYLCGRKADQKSCSRSPKYVLRVLEHVRMLVDLFRL